ncbi:MAG: tetratricopeptide repeat protein [Acidobacteria bacterium]|nr:tetratricopeptide repeat protein [Acidobacteriota bacterium]
MKWGHALAVICAGLLLIFFHSHWQIHAQSAAAQARGQEVTFNRDIAPIIFQNCARCHRPGEAGPFPLLTYTDAKKHARQIEILTRTRIMPPWLPDPQPLRFAEELRLSDQQIALIKKWVDEGTPEGNPGDLPPRPEFIAQWQLGRPDLVLKAAKPFLLPASGSDMYWNFIFPVPIERTRWVKAVEIRPGDKQFIHHANILVDRLQNSRQREKEPGAGFEGMEIKIESETFDPDSHFLFWKPGTVPYVEPEGMALRLDRGTDLVLNVHMQPSGKSESIQPAIGIYFTDQPATKFPMLLQLENDGKLDIPAGQTNFVVTDELRLPIDVDLLAIYPHAHYLGKDLKAIATLPDGSSQTLIHIPRWNLNWQAVYRYAEPVFLPKGSTIRMRYIYDNSGENPLNPNHPPERVRGGNRARDEMAHLWLQVLPRNLEPNQGDPRMALQEALARHGIQNNPADFASHYNLGAMLAARGKTADAIQEYETALRIRPQDATAQNALAAVLIRAGQPERAVPYLRSAISASPGYFDAHYNLGQVLGALGDFPGAAEEFSAAVRLRPDDADAHANLGSALAELGRFKDARTQFERALEINPVHQLARENLEQLESGTPER